MEKQHLNVWYNWIDVQSVLLKGIAQDSHLCENDDIKKFVHRIESISRTYCIEQKSKERPPIVVVEGLDGSGKTTLVKALVDHIEGVQHHRTPPFSALSIRNLFDSKETATETCRAFYACGNYIAGLEMACSSTRDVSLCICDRMWHSTVAYSLGMSHVSLDSLPLTKFTWPMDLVKPDVVIFLKVDNKERKKRITKRSGEDTRWEECLESESIRKKIEDTFLRIEPRVIEVDATKSKEEVLKQVMHILSKMNLIPNS